MSNRKNSITHSVGELAGMYDRVVDALDRWIRASVERTGNGVTLTRLRMLRILERDGPLKMGAIADLMGIAGSTTTVLVDALEREELVTRERHITDRRATVVAITHTGKATVAELAEAHDAARTFLFNAMSNEERDYLMHLYQRWLDLLEKRET